MLLNEIINTFKTNFPKLEYIINNKEQSLTIPAINNEVGDIVIEDELDEIIVFIGNFTHWHVGCYEENFNEKEKAIFIAEEITEFLTDLFNNQIVMWGSHRNGGGFYRKGNKPNSKSWFGKKNKEFVWSGQINS